MANPVGKISWKLMTILIALPISKLTTRIVEKIWVKVRPQDPPRDPASPDTGIGDAIAWALLSGLGIAVGRVIATRGAATAWRGLTGSQPPVAKSKAAARAEAA